MKGNRRILFCLLEDEETTEEECRDCGEYDCVCHDEYDDNDDYFLIEREMN